MLQGAGLAIADAFKVKIKSKFLINQTKKNFY
jgi:hypothetical protein